MRSSHPRSSTSSQACEVAGSFAIPPQNDQRFSIRTGTAAVVFSAFRKPTAPEKQSTLPDRPAPAGNTVVWRGITAPAPAARIGDRWPRPGIAPSPLARIREVLACTR